MRVLCDSNPMAWGSTAALLAVAEQLDVECVAMGGGVTRELLKADPAISSVVDVRVKEVDAVRKVAERVNADAVLVVCNRANLRTYLDLECPLFFVDLLYWYGGGGCLRCPLSRCGGARGSCGSIISASSGRAVGAPTAALAGMSGYPH
jgi:hypothetical protein